VRPPGDQHTCKANGIVNNTEYEVLVDEGKTASVANELSSGEHHQLVDVQVHCWEGIDTAVEEEGMTLGLEGLANLMTHLLSRVLAYINDNRITNIWMEGSMGWDGITSCIDGSRRLLSLLCMYVCMYR